MIRKFVRKSTVEINLFNWMLLPLVTVNNDTQLYLSFNQNVIFWSKEKPSDAVDTVTSQRKKVLVTNTLLCGLMNVFFFKNHVENLQLVRKKRLKFLFQTRVLFVLREEAKMRLIAANFSSVLDYISLLYMNALFVKMH